MNSDGYFTKQQITKYAPETFLTLVSKSLQNHHEIWNKVARKFLLLSSITIWYLHWISTVMTDFGCSTRLKCRYIGRQTISCGRVFFVCCRYIFGWNSFIQITYSLHTQTGNELSFVYCTLNWKGRGLKQEKKYLPPVDCLHYVYTNANG